MARPPTIIETFQDDFEPVRQRLSGLYARPGFKIRRLRQIAQSIFADACIDLDITTTQYGILFLLNAFGTLDQVSIGQLLGLDRSTTGLVVDLLAKRQLIAKVTDQSDQRRRVLSLRYEGTVLLERTERPAARAADRLLDCLSPREKRYFKQLLLQLIDEEEVAVRGADKLQSVEDLIHRPGFLIRRVHQRSVAIFTQACRELQLTTRQYGMLYVLVYGGSVDQITLARVLGVDRSTVALVVRLLSERGAIDKTIDVADHRKRLLRITETGTYLFEAAIPLAKDAVEVLLRPLTDQETEWILATMDRIINRHEARYLTVNAHAEQQ
jgi:DNA-binding MarR family transcriptional regulator